MTKRKFIVGLGNNDKQYEKTRHNAGFLFVDRLLERYDERNKVEKKLKSIRVVKVEPNVFLCKSKGLMNQSGLPIRELVNWFDIDSQKELIVAHDDLDIPLGKYKFQFAKSPKIHNGVISVENHLNTKGFFRLRIGIENRHDKIISGYKYVLGKFKTAELEQLYNLYGEIYIDQLAM